MRSKWNFDESNLTRVVLIEIDILGIVQITHLSISFIIIIIFGFVGLFKMFIRKVNEVVDKVSVVWFSAFKTCGLKK